MASLHLLHPALLRCLPFALFIGLLALRGAVEGHVDTRWLYGLQAGVAAVVVAFLFRHYAELHDPWASGRSWPPALLAVLSGLAVATLWVLLDEPWMRLGEPITSFVPLDAAGQLDWPLIAVRLAGAVLVVPLIEELFWRSFLMRWIDRRQFLTLAPRATSRFALVASSAVFALGHDLWLAGLIAGLVFGALYRHTGQLWHAVLSHAVANLALGLWVVHQRAWSFW